MSILDDYPHIQEWLSLKLLDVDSFGHNLRTDVIGDFCLFFIPKLALFSTKTVDKLRNTDKGLDS